MAFLNCLAIGFIGFIAYHLSKLAGPGDSSIGFAAILPYLNQRALNHLLSLLVFFGLFIAAWSGELTLLGFNGGAGSIGEYFLLGYMSPSLMGHWVKSRAKGE